MLETNKNELALRAWVKEVAKRTKPQRVVWCNGTKEEYLQLVKQMLTEESLIQLNQAEYPNCYLYRSHPKDVARSEQNTFICTPHKDDVGPTNNWIDPTRAKKILWKLLTGCMKSRTMYVMPYLLGPIGSKYSETGVELTDSSYVALNMMIMTKVGKVALKHLDSSGTLVRGIHSSGKLDPKNKYICHFPDEKLIISVNSNYGENALLSKKCHALRLATVKAKDEGWLAEHMFVIGVEDPNGNTTYVTGAFPSASGKTNLAMLKPPEQMNDWRVWAVSDDIAWMHLDTDGKLCAINPETGFFGVAPNTNKKTNPNIMNTIKKNTIFTNVAITKMGTP
ncbi:MAG: phosphoenolpyruvate carboxykinase domain-containing protein [Candidatus Bathyarchaeia archaeon]